MEHYVGLAISLKLTAICIVDRTGKIEREAVVHPTRRPSRHLSNRMRHISRELGLKREQRRRGYGPS
jgi:hypothetical protein